MSGTLEHAIDMTKPGDEPSMQAIFGRVIAWSGTTEAGQLQWSAQRPATAKSHSRGATTQRD